MSVFARLARLPGNLLRRRRADRELDEELRAYGEMLVDEKLQAGLSDGEARRQANLELGGLDQVKESVRDVWAGAFLETVFQDLRYGVRGLARNPGFTTAAVVALALGIGATTAIFSAVEAVLLRPLPYGDSRSLVVLLHEGSNPVAPANFADWRRLSNSFESMGAADLWVPNLTGGSEPESVQAVRLTADVLPMLKVAPLRGRLFRAEEDQPGSEHEVILSHALWRRRFAGDLQVVGRSITLNGESYTIVGVMPSSFDFPPFWATGTQLWAPLALGDRLSNRTGQSLRVFARTKPGVTLTQARAEIAAITARLERAYPGSNRNVEMRSLEEVTVGSVQTPLWVLFGAVGFVLLIACANVAHMLMARAAARQKEVALRQALGAGRARMIRQLLTESVALGLAGGAVGLGLAVAGTRVLATLGAATVPRLEGIGTDLRVLAFTLAISLVTGVVFGIAPALAASRRDAAGTLRESERGRIGGLASERARRVLIASEVALALVLTTGAGLMTRSFLALKNIDPGFDPRGLLTMTVSVAGTPEAQPSRRLTFYQRLLEKVGALPGVVSASAINHLPLAGDIWGWSFTIEGRPVPPPGESPGAAYRVVFPGYFRTMRLPIVRGRDFSESDRLGAPGAVVINEFLARRHWPGEEAIGKRITFDDLDKNPFWLTVVGVAKNAVRSQWDAAPEEEIYLSYLQTRNYLQRSTSNYAYMTLVVRTGGDPAALAPSVRQSAWSLDRNVTVSNVQTMRQVVGRAMALSRFYLLLLGAFAGIALTLAAVGIYGVMSYSVSLRTSEIGLRMALGAEQRDVLRLVVGQGMRVVMAGAAAGLAAALALTRLMSSLLYSVKPDDLLTFAAVSVLLVGTALLASYIPARRAARIDPQTALRHE